MKDGRGSQEDARALHSLTLTGYSPSPIKPLATIITFYQTRPNSFYISIPYKADALRPIQTMIFYLCIVSACRIDLDTLCPTDGCLVPNFLR